MPSNPLTALRTPILHELGELRANWGWFLILGIVTVVLGSLLLAVPFLGTLFAVWMLSVLLIVGGVFQFIGAFWIRRWSGFLLALLAGILYVALGILMIDQPVTAAAALTILIAAFLIVGGIFRIVAAFSYKFDGWIWPLLGGVISVVLGIMIWRQFPESAFWVIGLFLGIDMIFNGWTWIMIAMTLRRLPRIDPHAPRNL